LGERMIVCIDKKSSRTVSSWAEASDLIVSAWSARGARAFYSNPKAGIILDAAGQPVAHVSYNGAVWAGTARFGTGKEKLYPDQ